MFTNEEVSTTNQDNTGEMLTLSTGYTIMRRL